LQIFFAALKAVEVVGPTGPDSCAALRDAKEAIPTPMIGSRVKDFILNEGSTYDVFGTAKILKCVLANEFVLARFALSLYPKNGHARCRL
jgi:hypothetical protein